MPMTPYRHKKRVWATARQDLTLTSLYYSFVLEIKGFSGSEFSLMIAVLATLSRFIATTRYTLARFGSEKNQQPFPHSRLYWPCASRLRSPHEPDFADSLRPIDYHIGHSGLHVVEVMAVMKPVSRVIGQKLNVNALHRVYDNGILEDPLLGR